MEQQTQVGTSILKIVTAKYPEEVIRQSINNYIDEILASEKSISQNDKNIITNSKIEINIVKDRQGSGYGFSFIWVSSKEYYLLLGKELDGSDFEIKIINPEYTPAYNLDITNLDNIDFTTGDAKKYYMNWCEGDTKNWANSIHSFKEYLVEEQESKYITTSVRKYPYPKSDDYYFEITEGKAFLQESNNYDITKLKGEVEDWVTDEILHEYFDKFNTDNQFYTDYRKKTSYQYPIINTFKNPKNKKIAVIQFSKSADHITDASFAKLMRKKTTFTRENLNSESYFNFWTIYNKK
jgi:hypothetical protein